MHDLPDGRGGVGEAKRIVGAIGYSSVEVEEYFYGFH